MSSAWKKVAIGDMVNDVKTWNPLRSVPSDSFDYVDLSAIDQDSKTIIGVRKVICGDAPSRARQLVARGDVLVSTVRPNLNGVALVPEELDGATASTGFCVLRPRKDFLDGTYLFHWVKSPKFISDMVKKATGANYPAVSDRIISESQILLPPLEEQKRIAEILDRAEELRSKRREAIAQLDTLTQAIFIEMFGNPVTNPKGWNKHTLEEITMKITDGEHLNPAFSSDGMPIVMAGNVLEDFVDIQNAKKVNTSLGQRFRKKCNPEKGDILLVSRGATIGRLCTVDFSDDFCLMGSVILIKLNHLTVESRYLKSLLKHSSMYAKLFNTSGSSAQQAIYLKDLKRLICLLPPLNLQQKFAHRVEAVEKIKTAHRASLSELNTLFVSLQHRAFRGEL